MAWLGGEKVMGPDFPWGPTSPGRGGGARAKYSTPRPQTDKEASVDGALPGFPPNPGNTGNRGVRMTEIMSTRKHRPLLPRT